jgi:hypothetical protein
VPRGTYRTKIVAQRETQWIVTGAELKKGILSAGTPKRSVDFLIDLKRLYREEKAGLVTDDCRAAHRTRGDHLRSVCALRLLLSGMKQKSRVSRIVAGTRSRGATRDTLPCISLESFRCRADRWRFLMGAFMSGVTSCRASRSDLRGGFRGLSVDKFGGTLCVRCGGEHYSIVSSRPV